VSALFFGAAMPESFLSLNSVVPQNVIENLPTATAPAARPGALDRSAAVDGVLALIREDSQCSPAKYLDETVVPHGGE
jgi:hypothetical protein